MSRAYSDIAFTRAVRELQTRMGSRSKYEAFDRAADRRDQLGERETEFIRHSDHFFQATVGETGWPYVQHRGGPAGFLEVLDDRTIAYADFRGNVQYISVGNLTGNDRVSLILMDYANKRRLKILGHARVVEAADDPQLIARVTVPGYAAAVERAVVISIGAWDWNCPQHITQRFTVAEVEAVVAPLQAEIERLRARLGETR
jgi:predicted pyridoxine 5'-phosphate oxidase superfamily flavin-nucleotide-binding protein